MHGSEFYVLIGRVGPARKCSLFRHIMNHLLLILFVPGWRDIGLFLLSVFFLTRLLLGHMVI